MNRLLLPMLATSGQPIDSEDHLFEVKWDGVRALADVTPTQWQLWGRDRAVYTDRYPELDVLRRLPAGTVVDGELVMLRGGLPDLRGLLHRHPLVGPDRIRRASRLSPVHYVLFDLLASQGRSLFGEPLRQRRAALAELVAKLGEPSLVFAEGVIGTGREFFRHVVSQGHEGVMAKHLASRYCPGQRSPAWRKIKPAPELPCVVIGYRAGRHGVRSLLVATLRDGVLRYVGQLTSGWSDRQARELAEYLTTRRRPTPAVSCPHQAMWVEPELYCRVKFLRWTAHGRLRDAVFRGLLRGAPAPASPGLRSS
jgi:ATP-dependent DNA ligase